MQLIGPGVLAGYLDDVRERGFDDNPDQRRIARALDKVRLALMSTQRTTGHWPFSRRRRAAPARGLYIHGDVGRGKTYLMDLFFERVQKPRKLRQHFHRFMKNVHEQLGQLRDQADPLEVVAKNLADRYRLICFDEFFVSDIADAMLLGRLFESLFGHGVTLVATSNAAPDDLYRDGLQRSRFLPAIEQIKTHCEVIETRGASDYRLQFLSTTAAYHHPLDEDTERSLSENFEHIAPGANRDPGNITINHRPIAYVRRAAGAAWFRFAALCSGPRGTDDYIELARCFDTVILSDIPVLDETLENEARRFIALIDEFYDRRVKVILSAATALDDLYAGTRLKFEFRRTASRLREMQSDAYLGEAHRP